MVRARLRLSQRQKPREQPKSTEVGDATRGRNSDKILVNKGRIEHCYPSPGGEGCGDTLNGVKIEC